MKKYFIIFILSLSLSFLLISSIVSARQTSMSTYYPSPSGNYTKIILSNGTNGPDENNDSNNNSCFCAISSNSYTQNTTNPGYNLMGTCDIGAADALVNGNPANYVNVGAIFADPTTGYLEICKNDGSTASYPGACFTRFVTGSLPNPPCPTNYEATVPIQNPTFSMGDANNYTSWSCCFTGRGPNGITTTTTNISSNKITKSGCFSIYAHYNDSAIPPCTASPCECSFVDPNAYDIGCNGIATGVDDTTAFSKRDCCFNASSSGANINNISPCLPPPQASQGTDTDTSTSTSTYTGCPAGFKDCGDGKCWPTPCSCCTYLGGDIMCCSPAHPTCRPLSCFTSGTKILLANGQSVDIQDLKPGDVILGSNNNHNNVLKLVIMPKADRKIYAFNGGRYFVTESHPFMTPNGWEAINPQAAHLENLKLKIGQLKIGDELVTRQGLITLKMIEFKIVKDSVVYNPMLDGSHDYYADGFLVHNKLPAGCF